MNITMSALTSAAAIMAMSASMAVTVPAAAHVERGLSARVLPQYKLFCPDGRESLFCAIEGRVRVANHRARGSGRIPVCIGIDVINARGKSLSIEPRNPDGQAVASLAPGQTRVVHYRTVFRRPLTAKRPVVSHVHRHIAVGGRQC